MRFSAISFVFFVGIAQIACAQEIRWKVELSKPGDYVTIDQSDGGRIHHVFRGKSGKAFVVESFRGRTPEGKPVFTTYLDKDGNYLRWVRSDGFEIRYRPHGCTRTLGQCQYTEIDSNGKRESWTRITKATRRGFSYQEYDKNGKFYLGGEAQIDDRGIAGNGSVKGNQRVQKFRLIRRNYQ